MFITSVGEFGPR